VVILDMNGVSTMHSRHQASWALNPADATHTRDTCDS